MQEMVGALPGGRAPLLQKNPLSWFKLSIEDEPSILYY